MGERCSAEYGQMLWADANVCVLISKAHAGNSYFPHQAVGAKGDKQLLHTTTE